MNENSTHIELLLRYLDGTLTAEEQQAVETELSVNKEMQSDLNALKLARETVIRKGLRDDISKVRNQMVKESPIQQAPVVRMNRRRRLGLGVAASIIMLVVATIAYQYLNVSPEGLYKEMYKPYAEATYRGENSQNDLQQEYASKQYEKAIQSFNMISQPSAKDYFLAGQSFLAMDSAIAAINAFQQVQKLNQQDNTKIFQDDAEYYEGLALLRSGQIDAATKIFSRIEQNADHLYHDKVTGSFMSKLKRLSK